MRHLVHKQAFAILIILFLIVCLIYFVVLSLVILSGYKAKPTSNARAIIILGAKVNDFPATPSNVLKERLDTAIDYLDNNLTTLAIVSGGKGPDETESEACVMARYLIERGIQKNRVLIEDQSTSTAENLINSAHFISPSDKVVICTSDFHMYRSLKLARRFNYQNVSGCVSHSKTQSRHRNFIRELFALTNSILTSKGVEK